MTTMDKGVSGADVLVTGTTSTIRSLGANLLAAGIMAAGAVAFVGVCVPVAAINMCLASTITKPCHGPSFKLPELEPVSAGADVHVEIQSHAIEVETEWDDEEGAVEDEVAAVEEPAAVAEAVPVVAMTEGSRGGG